jgi:hypothetical protein
MHLAVVTRGQPILKTALIIQAFGTTDPDFCEPELERLKAERGGIQR